MYKYITILGAAGQIAQKLIATLLTYTDMHLTLYGRQLSTRLHPEILEHERVTVIEGSFQNPAKLEQAVTNAEIVFVGAMEAGSDMASIVKALSRKNVRRVIGFPWLAFLVSSLQHLKNGPSTTYRLAMYKANAKHAMYCANPT